MKHTNAYMPTRRQILRARIQSFGRDERGVMIVMTLLFFMMMLTLGGIAVDFMRFESRRAMLQSTADRAVLAAAKIVDTDDSGNPLYAKNPEDIVYDYFAKSGFDGAIQGTPDIYQDAGFNSVGVEARFEMDTFFLSMLGVDNFSAPAAATAVEGISKTKVSLVVDISGSMQQTIPTSDGSTKTRMDAMQSAATKFVENMLIEKYEDKISVSLVPYTEQVNIGQTLLAGLNVTPRHNYSHCIEFESSDFNKLSIDTAYPYEHMQHVQFNGPRASEGLSSTDNTTCPKHSYERIIPMLQDLDNFRIEIAKLKPRAGTSIFVGLKWGLALLDPSMASVLAPILAGGPFAGRPAAYAQTGQASQTQKVLVMMTDGQNDRSYRLHDQFASTPGHFANWNSMNWSYFKNYPGGGRNFNSWAYQKYDNPTGNFYMQQLCSKAKLKGVIIYAVAVDATTDGNSQMSQCASSPSHFFDATGNELDDIFTAIARQITELRLSL